MDDPPGGTRPSGAGGGEEPPAGAAIRPPADGERDRARASSWMAHGPPPGDAPPPDSGVVEAFGELLALAETLNELPLDGVEPLLGPPRWS